MPKSALFGFFLLAIVLAACSAAPPQAASETSGKNAAASTPQPSIKNLLPGMPPVPDPADIYSADRPNQLSPVVRDFVSRIYVPNTVSNTVDVIDPATYKVVDHFA